MKPNLPVGTDVYIPTIQQKYYVSRLGIFRGRTNAWKIYTQIAVMVLLLFPSSYGTSIIAILSNNTVVIAADTKRTLVGIPGAKSVSGCKLQVVNNFAWSMVGLDRVFSVNRDGSTSTIYDINDLMKRIARTKGTPQEKVARFDKLIRDAILSDAKTLRNTFPEGFALFSNGRVFLEVLLVGFQNGKVVISHREYGFRLLNGQIIVEQNPWKPDCPSENCHNPQFFFTGMRDAVERFFISHPQVFQSSSIDDLRNLAIRLVQMEIDDVPESVGGPIETATIDGGGVHWGQNNTVCPNGKRPSKTPPKLPINKTH